MILLNLQQEMLRFVSNLINQPNIAHPNEINNKRTFLENKKVPVQVLYHLMVVHLNQAQSYLYHHYPLPTEKHLSSLVSSSDFKI
jgi:hypothetical protein